MTENEIKLVETLKIMYAEPQRHYHTFTHIENLLSLFTQYQEQLIDKTAIYWAIYLHDCIYNPRNKDNEEQSAKFAEKALQSIENINNNLIIKISNFILATKTHQNNLQDADLQWFLDFDLAVLGSSEEIYTNYAANVRKEYQHIPMWQYRIGRRKVLQHFLAKTPIFHHLPATYEIQAKINLAKEYDALRLDKYLYKLLKI